MSAIGLIECLPPHHGTVDQADFGERSEFPLQIAGAYISKQSRDLAEVVRTMGMTVEQRQDRAPRFTE